MIRKKSEDAVSPVIGIMLLLVVTIVIAAVVAVFASGVGADAEPAPTTVLDVVEVYDKGYSDGAVSTESTPAVWFFEDYNFVNAVAEYQISKGMDQMTAYMEYAPNLYTEVGVEYNEYILKKDSITGGTLINDVLIVDGSGYVLENAVNNPLFTEVIKNYCFEEVVGEEGKIYRPVTITINCLAGDTLDLAKVSINVYDKNGVLVGEVSQNTLSGTISIGESKTINIKEIFSGEADDYNAIKSSENVEVFVLFGDHVLVSKDIKVRG